MNEIQIMVINDAGKIKKQVAQEKHVVLVYRESYEKGDNIHFVFPETGKFYKICVDDVLGEGVVYITKDEWIYEIPFDEKKTSYNPKSFVGELHYISCQELPVLEICNYRNLAMNVMDQAADTGCYPHAHANVETRGEAVFAARNAIDGMFANDNHGMWPYESWGINRQADAEFILEFGRPVDFNKIAITTRADFPHDNWWIEATLSFSDGTSERITMKRSKCPQEFSISRNKIQWIKLERMIQSEDPSPFPALTQFEVYGTEATCPTIKDSCKI